MHKNIIMLREAKKAKFQPNLLLLLAIIIVLFISTYIIPQIFLGKFLEFFHLSDELEEISYLFITIITTLAAILYCTKVERRSLHSMGFTKNRIVRKYFVGMLIGLLLLSLVIGVCVLFGAVNIVNNKVTPIVFLFFIGYIIQGMSEEVALRGCFMVSATNKVPIPVAILISSLFFAIPHFFFSNGQLLFTVNTLLMGILLSVYILQTDNIWGASGIHTAFNFFGRCMFNSNSEGRCTLFNVTSDIPGKEWIGGNSYGYTSGLGWTIIIVAFIALTILSGRLRKLSGTNLQ